ncbi:PLAC8-domain-containing protein [Auriscalpium vulgare]|uniref:PLAC8-domain-containing protein n=1 Tax=Auriscalpium vulgare TaxID=40419 RepID=A0ACB8SB61_9AGAM|nr:PLAC8-domain-containing protein [Auriscalpium vulgare]
MQGMQLLPGGNRNALNKKFNSKGERDWSHGLCSCFEDCGTCCLACWCPCVVYGKNKQRIDYLERRGTPRPDGGATFSADCTMHALAGCLGGWGWVLQIGSRGEVRTRYNIRGTVFEDCCISFWCNGCDLVQEHREIQAEEQSFGRPMP